MTLGLRSARSLAPDERAELFNAAYEGYLIPFHVDETALASIDDVFDHDLDASRIAFRGETAVGLGNLGVRGEDGWVGGVGVVPAARRSGIGEALMRALHEQARERGIRRMWLEVIAENTGAYALYEKLGTGPSATSRSGASLAPRKAPPPRARFPPPRRTPASASSGTRASRGSARTRRSRTTETLAGS